MDTTSGWLSLGAGWHQSTWRGDRLWHGAVWEAVEGAKGSQAVEETAVVLVTNICHPFPCRDTECQTSDLRPFSVLSVSLRQARGGSAETWLRPIAPHWTLAWWARWAQVGADRLPALGCHPPQLLLAGLPKPHLCRIPTRSP